MEIIPSFALLAARLAAEAAAIRAGDETRDDLAKLAALVMCALLDMLICVCAALDARALLGVGAVAVPSPRDHEATFVPVARARRQTNFNEGRLRAPCSVHGGCAVAPRRRAAPSEAVSARLRAGLVTRPCPIRVVSTLRWQFRRERRLFHQPLRTPIMLRYRN